MMLGVTIILCALACWCFALERRMIYLRTYVGMVNELLRGLKEVTEGNE